MHSNYLAEYEAFNMHFNMHFVMITFYTNRFPYKENEMKDVRLKKVFDSTYVLTFLATIFYLL